MKLIEAMKQTKDLKRKAEDLRGKIGTYCANLDFETPMYEDQRATVAGWLQAHGDIVKELLRLKIAIQRTNLATPVTIELGGVQVTHTIAEWVHRRRDLAPLDLAAWKSLSDRGLREGKVKQTTGEEKEVRIRRYYEPRVRDERVELYTGEPAAIDARLEVVNAVTDLVEL